jgi:hypothetical protein
MIRNNLDISFIVFSTGIKLIIGLMQILPLESGSIVTAMSITI